MGIRRTRESHNLNCLEYPVFFPDIIAIFANTGVHPGDVSMHVAVHFASLVMQVGSKVSGTFEV
jgi:hypothetical protein